MRELALFAGAGGGILGGKLLGWRTVCAVEIDAYCRRVLMQRQNDGVLPAFPIWDDVRTFNGLEWRGLVDVVSGGFPCQDISSAGGGAGIEGEKSGLWLEMARIIREVRPTNVFVENSPMLTARGLGRVLGDLATMGFDAQWGVVSAADVGANHLRERIWIVAHTQGLRRRQDESVSKQRRKKVADTHGHSEELADANGQRFKIQNGAESNAARDGSSQPGCETELDGDASDAGRIRHRIKEAYLLTRRNGIERRGWWSVEPDVGRVAHGIPSRVDRIKALGNAQVPLVAATAWKLLNKS